MTDAGRVSLPRVTADLYHRGNLAAPNKEIRKEAERHVKRGRHQLCHDAIRHHPNDEAPRREERRARDDAVLGVSALADVSVYLIILSAIIKAPGPIFRCILASIIQHFSLQLMLVHQ